MSPLAAVALARDQGVRTVVHVSTRDRNRLALRSEVVGAAALGCHGIVCLQGDDVDGVRRVRDLTGTELLAAAAQWMLPLQVPLGCVVNPFTPDLDRELRLLRRKLDAGAIFGHTQFCLDLERLERFIERASTARLLEGLRMFVSVAVLRDRAMAERALALPGTDLPAAAYAQICAGGGEDLAVEMAERLAQMPAVDALHVMPLGDERTAGRAAAAFRLARGAPLTRGRGLGM
jgi:methylenetetrahydrofolate reductase (NADPH)